MGWDDHKYVKSGDTDIRQTFARARRKLGDTRMNYEILPEHTRISMRLYIEEGVEPRPFLLAVLCNDLLEALHLADTADRQRLLDYGVFLHCEAPKECYGSRSAVARWIVKGGMNGNATTVRARLLASPHQ